MKSNKLLVKRVNTLLENKNLNYRKKFYILARLSESKIVKNEKLLEETICLIKTLNRTQGDFPSENYLYSHLQESFLTSGMSKNRVKLKVKSIKETVNLKYNSIVTSKSMILEELGKIKISDAVLDKKLENTLIESYYKKVSLVKEQEEDKKKTKKPYFILDDIPEKHDEDSLKQTFKARREEDLEDMYLDDDALTFIEDRYDEEEEEIKDYSTARTSNIEINDIINKYSFLFDKKSFPMIRNDLKIYLPSDAKWSPDKLNKNDKLYIIAMYRLVKEQKASDSAMRKFFLFDKIRTYLNVRKRFVDDEIIAVGTRNIEGGTSKFTSSSTNVPNDRQEELRKIYIDFASKIGPDIGQTLNSDIVEEEDLITLLFASAGALKDDAEIFIQSLADKFPEESLSKNEVEEILDASELKELEIQNKEFDERSDERFGGDDQDDNGYVEDIKDDEVSEIDVNPSQEIMNLPVVRMSELDALEYFKDLNKDLNRLGELNKKLEDKDPDIFAPFEVDSDGNIIFDGEQETIPAEGLTDQEIKEYEKILERISYSKKIEVIGLDKRAEIYDQMYERGATPEEFARFMKSFGLSKEEKSKSYADIARSSYGDFRGTPAARQYALKAWFKGNYYSLNPKEKASIYAQIGERWFESITKLDLIEDEAFQAQGMKSTPKMNAFFNKIPRYLNAKTLEKYFDAGDDDNLDAQVSEEIQSLMNLSENEEEFNQKLRELEKTNPLFEKYAVLETMINGTSGFRIFATTMLKEFYNNYVWPSVYSDIAYAIKEFYEKYYPGSKIGASLKPGDKPGDVPKSEGRDLFNPIAYLAMSATGIPGSQAYSAKGETEAHQRKFFLGLINRKGDFSLKVKKFNQEQPQSALYGRENNRYNPLNQVPYGPDDVNLLLDDIFKPGGIIFSAKERLRNITKDSSNEFITFLGQYKQERIDVIVINAMAMSHVLRKGADPMNKEIFDAVGKDTVEAFSLYKKTFAPQLTSETFAEYLKDEFGYSTTNTDSRLTGDSVTSKNMM